MKVKVGKIFMMMKKKMKFQNLFMMMKKKMKLQMEVRKVIGQINLIQKMRRKKLMKEWEIIH